jgi:hypothetical protein
MLTISQVAELAVEINKGQAEIVQALSSLEQNVLDKQEAFDRSENFKLFFTEENSKADAYQNERRWLDGVTANPILFSEVDASAQRETGNIFFPADWRNFPPKVSDSSNGDTATTSTDSEDDVLNDTFNNNGLLALTDFVQNGQTGGVGDTLRLSYSGGTSLEADLGNQTPGNLILVYGGGKSALLRVVNVVTVPNGSPPPDDFFTVNVTIVIATDGTIPAGGTIAQTFSFSNAERNDPATSPYPNVLNSLLTSIKTRVDLWDDAVENQELNLQVNLDSNPDNDDAETDAGTARTVISTWIALPDTGSTGSDSKLTDNNLASIETEAADRNTFRPSRISQIDSSLGVVSQDDQGKVTGNGIYWTRFESISVLINALDGPLAQFYNLDVTASVSNSQLDNAKTKIRLFSTKVLTVKLAENPTGNNIIEVTDATGFSVSDQIVLAAQGLEDIVATIDGISSNTLTLSKSISVEYNVDASAGIAKAK